MRLVSRSNLIWPLLLGASVIAASSRPVVEGLGFEGGDKVAHFAVYGLLGTLLARVMGSGWRGAVLALATASLFGATDEWHQSFVPGRDSDVMDWLADSIGAALAVGLYCFWRPYRELLERGLPKPDKGPQDEMPS